MTNEINRDLFSGAVTLNLLPRSEDPENPTGKYGTASLAYQELSLAADAFGRDYSRAVLAHAQLPVSAWRVAEHEKLQLNDIKADLKGLSAVQGYTAKLVVVVMQGCPGSGKSTAAQRFYTVDDAFYQATVASADHFFEHYAGLDRVGNLKYDYKFDPSLLGQAHTLCRLKAIEALQKGRPVVIDNTHCGPGDLAATVEYVLRASSSFAVTANIVPVVLVVTLVPPKDVRAYAEVCAERNQHGVPFDVILRMATALKTDDRVSNPLTAYRTRR